MATKKKGTRKVGKRKARARTKRKNAPEKEALPRGPVLEIIGTSHISPQSIRTIRDMIHKVKPTCVAVELDPGRYVALKQGKKITLRAVKVIGVRNYVFAKVLSAIQNYLGKKTGVVPGDEMLAAVYNGRVTGADIAFIDQPISRTLNGLKRVPLREKIRIVLSLFRGGKKIELDLRKVPPEELVQTVLTKMREKSPVLYRVLVDERDEYMARVIHELQHKYERIVVVVGMGHKEGLEKRLGC